MKTGGTFFSDRGGRGNHLWVILSDPSKPKVVLVNFSSIKGTHDSSCVTVAGEHPNLPKASFAFYVDAFCANGKKLAAQWPHFDKGAPVSDDLLKRLREGAMISDDCPAPCRKVLLDQDLVET